MKVNKRVIEIYNNEFSDLVERLKSMPKEERFAVYRQKGYLFAKSTKVVHLEDQISGRSDYIHKFKRSFFIIGNLFFSTNYFGEYNQDFFKEYIGSGCLRYPQKVILALALMGYITGKRCNYSVGNHGTQYYVNYQKYKGWGDEFFEDVYFDEETPTCLKPEFGDEWLWDKQIETLHAIKVNDDFYSSVIRDKDGCLVCLSNKDVDKNDMRELKKKLDLIHKVETLKHKTDSCMKITIDGQEGRLYSIMTRMKSDYRHSSVFTINGERFREVDLCNAQPTLLGLMVKQKVESQNQQFHSLWLEQALSGTFYEWIAEITGLTDIPVNQTIKELTTQIEKDKKSKKKKVREQACELEDIVKQVKNDPSEKAERKLRKLVKHWLIKFLFGKKIVCPDDKEVKGVERKFLKRLCKYLYENETHIYNELIWYKKHTKPKKKKPTEDASELARKLQEEEVKYIKQCLRNLDPHIHYLYTVHDCIGCLESDVEKVISIMEQTAVDYYGVKLKLKIEK